MAEHMIRSAEAQKTFSGRHSATCHCLFPQKTQGQHATWLHQIGDAISLKVSEARHSTASKIALSNRCSPRHRWEKSISCKPWTFL